LKLDKEIYGLEDIETLETALATASVISTIHVAQNRFFEAKKALEDLVKFMDRKEVQTLYLPCTSSIILPGFTLSLKMVPQPMLL